MKRILLAIACLSFMYSCGVTKYSQITYLADYRTHTENGFTITPSSSGFTYKSIGDISMEFKIGKKDGYTNPDAEYGMEHVYIPNYDYITSEMVKEAKSLGADALLGYKIVPIFNVGKFGSTIVGYNASGFAVKLISNK